MIRISVIIPVFNDHERLRLCLQALAEQTLARENYEVIVVDNLSDPPLSTVVEAFDFCRYATESKPGSYAARNTGIQLAKGEVLAFTDGDCIPSPQWLELGCKALDERAPDGSVGGGIELYAADPENPGAVELYDIVFGLNQRINVSNSHYAATANMFTTRATLEAVGPFISEILSSGDMEWGQRVHAAGRPVVYAPEALIRHPARDQFKQVMTQALRHAGGRIDLGKVQKKKRSFFDKLALLWKKLCPQFRRMGIARGILRDRGYGFAPWARSCGVLTAIQYIWLFEYFRLRLFGGQAEKR